MEQVGALVGRRILVIEDDYLVAQILTALLEDAGAVVLGPIGWRDEALSFIERDSSTFDSALLDINLHGQTSYPIADALTALGIRFAFTTGYDMSAIDEAYRDYPRCAKPFQEDKLLAALAMPTT
jgi:CheY-like chemotaxis protein